MNPALYVSGDLTAAGDWNKSNYVDGSAFAGTLNDAYNTYASAGYVAVHIDSAGKVAWCHLGAAGGGETLGSELLSNTAFSNTTNVTPVDSTIASIAGGQSGNCLEVTIGTGKTVGYATETITVTPLVNHKLQCYIKKGTCTNCFFRFYNAADDSLLATTPVYTNATFSNKTPVFIPKAGVTSVKVAFCVTGVATQIGYFDTATMKAATAAAAASCMAYKDAALSTSGWNIDSGFNPMAVVSSWIVDQA